MTRTWGDYVLVERKSVPEAVMVIGRDMAQTIAALELNPDKRYRLEWTMTEVE